MQTHISTANYMAIPGLMPGTLIVGNRKNVDDIISIVCDEFGLTSEEIKSRHRYRRLTDARSIAIFLIRKHTNYSLFDTAKIFGGRDHTTALHSLKRIQELMDTEPDLKNRILLIENKLS